MPPASQRIGRFNLLKELGKGSQGVVYLAADPQLERNVAIKTIQLRTPSPQLKAQFLQEARTVSKLQHPNIVTLYETGEVDDKPYLVFEFVNGNSLREKLKQQQYNTLETINLMIPLLDAIGYAHQQDVIHRDLTPANIMVVNGGTPRLMDFGIASLVDAQADSQQLWGTLKYMSPEQCENKPVTPASDLFSLGLIMLEMLSGKPAIETGNQYAAINKIVNEEIAIPNGIEPAMGLIINKALRKDPQERYHDASDMRQDLNDLRQQLEPGGQSSIEGDTAASTLDFLLRRMQHKKDFPAMSQQVLEISNKSSVDSKASANELANKILENYSLSTKLLKVVNSSFYSQYGGRISTVSRAVVILGFKEVRMSALGLVLFDHLKSDDQSAQLKETAISSMMSGAIARELAADMKLRDTEEAYICSMFRNLGKMLAIYYFPEEVSVINNLVSQKNQKESSAARSVLGLNYEELGTGIAKAWQLPQQITQSMKSLDPRALQKASTSEEKLIQLSAFSNDLCELIQTTAEDRKNQAFKSLVARYGQCLDISRNKLDKLLEASLKNLSEYAAILNLDLHKSHIVKQARNWSGRRNETPETSMPPAAVPAAEADNPLASQENLINSIQEVTDAILEGASLNDVIVMVTETIYRNFGFDHVLFCIINKKQCTIDARFGFGNNVEEMLRELRIPLVKKPDVFNQSLRTHKDLVIDNIHDPTYADLIPAWYETRIGAKAMIVYPIIVNKIPMGILYADKREANTLNGNRQLGLIKTLRNQMVMAVKQSTT